MPRREPPCSTFVLQGPFGLDPFYSAPVSLSLALLMVLAAPSCAVLVRRAGARLTTGAAMALLGLGILVLSRAAAVPALCLGFALMGAGFGTVTVAATHVVVREAARESAGVAGGLQQTAMNLGPVLGVALATALMGSGGRPELPMGVLAALALSCAVLGRMLPARADRAIDDHDRAEDRTPVPARR